MIEGRISGTLTRIIRTSMRSGQNSSQRGDTQATDQSYRYSCDSDKGVNAIKKGGHKDSIKLDSNKGSLTLTE